MSLPTDSTNASIAGRSTCSPSRWACATERARRGVTSAAAGAGGVDERPHGAHMPETSHNWLRWQPRRLSPPDAGHKDHPRSDRVPHRPRERDVQADRLSAAVAGTPRRFAATRPRSGRRRAWRAAERTGRATFKEDNFLFILSLQMQMIGDLLFRISCNHARRRGQRLVRAVQADRRWQRG